MGLPNCLIDVIVYMYGQIFKEGALSEAKTTNKRCVGLDVAFDKVLKELSFFS